MDRWERTWPKKAGTSAAIASAANFDEVEKIYATCEICFPEAALEMSDFVDASALVR